jgi:hypothetical protein
MSVPLIQTSFVTGEVAPALFGHVDLARMKSAASTERNMYVGYYGGAYSRAGTKFVGFSKQTGRSFPPRLVPFQFSIDQGLALEFGNFYMRVISDGAFVTESPLPISGITRANPGRSLARHRHRVGLAERWRRLGILCARRHRHACRRRSHGDGDCHDRQHALQSLALNAPGTGYAPGDTINLAGGTQTTQAQVQVTTTKVVAAAIGVAGNGAIPNGVQTAVVLTGAGTAAQITVQVAGGVVVAINAIAVAGSYTTNPTTFLSQVLIAGNASCFLNLTMGVNSFNLIAPGVFTANPGGGTFTQGSTTGGGTGATFNTALMVPNDVHISTAGAYTVFPASPAAQAATSGTGVGVTFNIPARRS